jgi:hypothetical protein
MYILSAYSTYACLFVPFLYDEMIELVSYDALLLISSVC